MFIGEIKQLPYKYPIRGLLLCDGSLLNIMDYPLLYSVIKNMYGGDGITTFALPNLLDRTPIHAGTGLNLTPRTLGTSGGESEVALNYNQMANHGHLMYASLINGFPAITTDAVDNFIGIAKDSTKNLLLRFTNGAAQAKLMDSRLIGITGEGMPHPNIQPSIRIYFYISNIGQYPAS